MESRARREGHARGHGRGALARQTGINAQRQEGPRPAVWRARRESVAARQGWGEACSEGRREAPPSSAAPCDAPPPSSHVAAARRLPSAHPGASALHPSICTSVVTIL